MAKFILQEKPNVNKKKKTHTIIVGLCFSLRKELCSNAGNKREEAGIPAGVSRVRKRNKV